MYECMPNMAEALSECGLQEVPMSYQRDANGFLHRAVDSMAAHGDGYSQQGSSILLISSKSLFYLFRAPSSTNLYSR